MSSTPTAPTSTTTTTAVVAKPATVAPTTLSGVIAKDWSWILSHLLALIVVGALVVGGVYGVETLISNHDAQTATKYNAILAIQTTQVQTLQKQLSTDEASWATVEAQLLAQNAQLTQQISARNQVVAAQVKTDATLSAQDSALRISQDTKAAAGEVTAQNNNVVLDLPVTRTVVADLDMLPAVQTDLKDTQTQLVNEITVATNAQADTADAKKVIAAQTTQLVDADKACQAQIKAVNAKARRGKLKAFFIGAATVLGFWAGHSL
jgi:hypothetical protein